MKNDRLYGRAGDIHPKLIKRLYGSLTLTRLQLAELLLEHYPEEKAEALEHLNFAIRQFRDMKMKPSLERALKYKEILGA